MGKRFSEELARSSMHLHRSLDLCGPAIFDAVRKLHTSQEHVPLGDVNFIRAKRI